MGVHQVIQTTLEEWSEQRADELAQLAADRERAAARKRVASALSNLDAALLPRDAPAAAAEWAPLWSRAAAALWDAGRTLGEDLRLASVDHHGVAAQIWNLALAGATDEQLAESLTLALSTMGASFRHAVCALTIDVGEELTAGHTRVNGAAAASRVRSSRAIHEPAMIHSHRSGLDSNCDGEQGGVARVAQVVAHASTQGISKREPRAHRRRRLAVEKNVEELAEELTDRHVSILAALLEAEACSSEARKSAASLCRNQLGDLEPKLLRHPFTELVGMKLIKSAGGPSGGYWITEFGRQVAEHRSAMSKRARAK
jgi:hypothetical protein